MSVTITLYDGTQLTTPSAMFVGRGLAPAARVVLLAPAGGQIPGLGWFLRVQPDARANTWRTQDDYDLNLRRGRLIISEADYTSSFNSGVVQIGTIAPGERVSLLVCVRSVSGDAATLTLTVSSSTTSEFSTSTARATQVVTAAGMYLIDISGPVTDGFWRIYATITGSSPIFRLLAAIAMLGAQADTWREVTVPLPDQPPATPTAPTPADAGTDVNPNIVLAWSAPHATTYDVYFGTTNPPALVSSAQSLATYSPGRLEVSAPYYWQVIAHNYLGDATGPVWSFSTAASVPWEETDMRLCEGRLSLTTGTPITAADVTAATTLYFTPFRGNRIELYSGAAWVTRAFSELSLSLAGFAADTNFDVFAFDNSGTVALETLAWTNATTRATVLLLQEGVYVKSGATTRRYLGTFRTTGTIGQTEDSFAKRFLWNCYHRVRRGLRVRDTTSTWTYTTSTWRQANGAGGNQLAVVVGLAEVELEAAVLAHVKNATVGISFHAGIGEDSTSAPATNCLVGAGMSYTAAHDIQLTASLRTRPAVGYHYYAWLEISAAVGTSFWMGRYDSGSGGPFTQSGISGSIEG